MYIHWLVWDDSYSDHFLKDLLTALFDITTYCQHVILVIPPGVAPADMFEQEMTRIPAECSCDSKTVQFLYLSDRDQLRPKLRIRRIVEEDNDDVVPIIDNETTRLKELYGEYYISEMIRNPDGCRQLIVGEDVNGSIAGAICLNSTIDIDLLNENFELTAYHGLRKPHENNEELSDVIESTSELLQIVFSQMSHKYTDGQSSQSLKDDSLHEQATEAAEDKFKNESFSGKTGETKLNENGETAAVNARLGMDTSTRCEVSFQQDIEIDNDDDVVYCYHICTSDICNVGVTRQIYDAQTITPDSTESSDARIAVQSSKSDDLFCESHSDEIAKSSVSSPDNSQLVSIVDDDLSNDDPDVRFQSKMQACVLGETMFELPHKRNGLPDVEDNETTVQSRLIPKDLLLPRPTAYHGEKNAFVLEIFAMRAGEMRPPHWSLDFLQAAFDCFPDLDYCVILLPFSHPSQQYLQHFVRVPFKCNRDFPLMLYVLHRSVLFGEIKCRRAQSHDRNAVQGLLAVVTTRRETLADFDLAMDPLQLDLDCFVFECNSTMLGLAILRAEKQLDFIRSRYHVEDHVSMQSIHQDDYGQLLHFVLTPIFLAYHRFFFREITRLSGLTVIFYRLHHEDESALTRQRPLAFCLDDLVLVNPRKQAGYKFPDISRKIDKTENDKDIAFSLFMMSPRQATMSPAIVDLRILVVGASDCGVALAEYLVLRSRYRYTNLTLISPNGLPFDSKRGHAETSLLPFRGTFCPNHRCRVPLRTWINVVYGTMVAINRKKKYVTVMDQGNLAYDYLVLTCGLQYQRQPTLREETKTQKRGQEVTVKNQMKLPWNCLTINDDTEASVCLKKIRWLTEDFKEERAILLYGRNIDCYCALRGLIAFGVNPSWITLIEPSLNSGETRDDIFCCEADEAITSAILRNGIQILSGWCMIDWTLTRDADGQITIENVTIEKEGEETRTMVCDVLLNFHEKTINLDAFLAFCRAGLIFNGSLIIDAECRTNDPFIFAAGTMTKYSRKFRAESSQHIYFSSAEVGEKFAEILRRVIDVSQRSNEETSQSWKKEKTSSIPSMFRAPVVIACILPGDYHYLHVRKPGKETLCEAAINQKPSSEVFVTGSCTSETGYFRIRLNLYDSVDTITCVSKKTFQVQDMIALYGKHESMLNELKFRYKRSTISDFYSYFREPWATAIFHDRFECMRVENRGVLLSQTHAHNDCLVDDCVRALIKFQWQEISEEDRRRIELKYAGSVYHREIEHNLIRFLEFYENELPMYCTPYKQRQMYLDIAESPLYFEQ